MKADAETHAGEDAKRKELVEVKNVAEQLIYAAEKALRDAEGPEPVEGQEKQASKVPAEIVTEVTEKVAALRAVHAGEDMDAIKKASEELGTSMSKIGEAMMAQQPAEGVPADGATPEAGATDAEFTEKAPDEEKPAE